MNLRLSLFLILSIGASGCRDRSVGSVAGDSVSAIRIVQAAMQPPELPSVVVRLRDPETVSRFLECTPIHKLPGAPPCRHRPVTITFFGAKTIQGSLCEDCLTVEGAAYSPPPGFWTLVKEQVDPPEDVREKLRAISASALEAWLKENPADADQISGAKIVSITIEDQTIEVVLMKNVGPGGPEGMHLAYFHVFLDRSFRVIKTVRGPDAIS